MDDGKYEWVALMVERKHMYTLINVSIKCVHFHFISMYFDIEMCRGDVVQAATSFMETVKKFKVKSFRIILRFYALRKEM